MKNRSSWHLVIAILGISITVCAASLPASAGKTADKPAAQQAPAATTDGGAVQLGGTVVGGEFVKWPIAITALRNFGQQPDTAGLGRDAQQVLTSDLSITGVFDILDPKSFIENNETAGITEGTINFTDWLNIGAHGLIKGGIWLDGEKVKVDLRLFDTGLQKQVVGKEYSGEVSQLRHMIHRFSAEVVSYFTNGRLKGVYNTKIACVRKTGSSKELYLMDFDGYGGHYITNNNSLNLLPSWNVNGKELFFTSYISGDPDLYSIGLTKGSKPKVISNFKGLDMGAAMSPDGTKIALSLTKDDNAEVYVMNADGTGLKRLTTSWGIDISPTWSPDGKKIAFVSNRSGNPHVYIMDANGDNQERLTFVGNYNQSPAWSPKGDRIAFVGRDERYVFDIFTINVQDRMDVQRLTQDQGNNENPSWAPDGRHIVFSSNRSGEYKLYIMTHDGNTQQRITTEKGEFTTPTWSPWLSWD